MNEQRLTKERSIWGWHTLYILAQWPFILVGMALTFVYSGMELGWIYAKYLEKKVEDKVP
jgi:hypothetical protein